MKDIKILFENKPGQLALVGEILGDNKISLEGGGVFNNEGYAIAHFLVKEADRAKIELEKAGVEVKEINDVIIQKLRQDIPGQLGSFCRKMADAQVNILTQYSDHSNQLIIVPDNYDRAKIVSEEWMKTWWENQDYVI